MVSPARTLFQADLDEISKEIRLLAAHVTEGIPAATEALLAGDLQRAQRVIDNDDVLDALAVDIEERCYRTLATRHPVAADLRAVVAALRMVAEIERSGDLVVNIAKVQHSLGRELQLPPSVRGSIQEMGELATQLFRACVDAYAEGDARLAARLDRMDDPLDAVHGWFVDDVLDWAEAGNARAAVKLALIGRYYERIGDHAVNIGERVQFLLEGRIAVGQSPGEER